MRTLVCGDIENGCILGCNAVNRIQGCSNNFFKVCLDSLGVGAFDEPQGMFIM